MAKGDVDYDELAANLLEPANRLASGGEARVGSAAAAVGREFLVREYGSEEEVERAMRPGRPRLGEKTGPSPTVRARVSQKEFTAIKELEAKTGRSQSELVREAIHRYLSDQQFVS